MPSPSGLKRCRHCGTDLTRSAPEGFCAACMLESGLREEDREENGETRVERENGDVRELLPSFGDYELIEEVARGGMGVVYKARQISLNRIVALKMILTGRLANAAELQRFRTEAETAARLQHPNIVSIHEIGERNGEQFFSMDYVSGKSLAELARNEPLVARRAATYVKTIAEAIRYAHAKGVLHRDLKPSNILIDQNDQPRITDFGLAKRLDDSAFAAHSELTLTGQVLGSPNFMPPEQARGDAKNIGPASDVYALGAILYYLITARAPFAAESLTEILHQVVNKLPTSPSLLNPGLSRDLETICLKCLEKEPRRRYATAFELAAELGRFLGGEEILARPISPAAKAWRWCKLKPVVSSLTAFSLLLLLAIAVGSPVAIFKINREKRQATEKLLDSYLAQARANRWSGRAGRRFESLDVLTKAAAIRPLSELRNEAIACMVLPDVRLEHEWRLNRADPELVSVDANLSLYARAERGDIFVRRLADNGLVAQFNLAAAKVWLVHLSRDGRWLAAEHHPGTPAQDTLSVWDINSKQLVWQLPGGINHFAVDFSPDSRLVAVGSTKGSILVYDLVAGHQLLQFPSHASPYSLRFSPDSRQLAICSRNDPVVEICKLASGAVSTNLIHSQGVSCAEWHPGGNLLATACEDLQIYLWDVTRAQRVALLQGHTAPPEALAFNHRGDWLVSSSPHDALYIWEPPVTRPMVRLPRSSTRVQFSGDDSRIVASDGAPELGLIEVARPRECRVLRGTGGRVNRPSADFNQDGRILATAESAGVRLWDTLTTEPLGFVPFVGCQSVILHPEGHSLICSGVQGVHQWPIRSETTKDGTHLKIGPAQRLEPPAAYLRQLVLSPDGQQLAVRRADGILLLQLDHRGRQLLPQKASEYESASFSSDGNWLAASAWPEDRAKIWNVKTGELVHTVESPDIVNLAFSPDGRWLVTCGLEEYRFCEIDSWKPARTISRLRSGRSVGPTVLICAGTMMAVSAGEFGVDLLEAATGKSLAVLDQSEQLPVCFSRDGRELVTIDATGANYLWDLRAIRHQLAAMNLDWPSPPIPPPATNQFQGKIKITVLEATPEAGRSDNELRIGVN